MRVIGTAGHVDHGKSTLVKCLTGIDPDRWQEEKSRGLTIDLGFAWFTLPKGVTVGIVDVPGHRDFIENMLAGVGGIDIAVLVVAADEGVMPQTREHLAILDLLAIPQGVIVLTKVDLINDSEWLDLVELDVQETVADTVLADAPIVRVSAVNGSGMDALTAHLSAILDQLPSHTDYNQPRLPVDRVFSVEGFGTVVTGTLSGGTLSVGDMVELQPMAISARIRGLQSYKRDIENALPGSRVAVNLSGISTEEVTRGNVLAYPGQLQSTRLIDVHFKHLANVDRPLQHNAEVKFFSGASEIMATVRLLSHEQLPPDAEGWLQLRLRDPIPLTQRDRFILRYPSPAQTIGGGIVVNPHPERRWKRFNADLLNQLQTRLAGTPAERVTQSADRDTPQKRVHLQQTTAYADSEFHEALEQALTEQRIIAIDETTFWAMSRYHAMLQQILTLVTAYHQQNPLRIGIPREELRSRLGIKNALLSRLLALQEHVVIQRDVVKLPDHTIQFTPTQQSQIAQFIDQMQSLDYKPLSYKEAVDLLGEPLLHALMTLGEVEQVAPDVIFLTTTYQQLLTVIRDLFAKAPEGRIDVKDVRDALNTSRKYAVAVLEYLDTQGITRRVGDVRLLIQ
ncbi:MAG: selenocysteine-specific translation elongation factor [Anaerolineae bacterium]